MFYTSSLHPVYEEIPTPRGGGGSRSTDSDYQLLNTEYSSLPYSATCPVLPDSMVGLLPPSTSTAADYTKPCDSFASNRRRQNGGNGRIGGDGGSKTCDKRMRKEGRNGGSSGKRRFVGGGGARTLDPRSHGQFIKGDSNYTYQMPHAAAASRLAGTGGGHQDYLPRIGCNQADFLPREAWTDFSGSDDWMDPAAAVGDRLRRIGPVGAGGSIRIPRLLRSSSRGGGGGDSDLSPVCGGGDRRSRLISSSSQSREISPTLNSLESSDVTMSTSSSETYPKCPTGQTNQHLLPHLPPDQFKDRDNGGCGRRDDELLDHPHHGVGGHYHDQVDQDDRQGELGTLLLQDKPRV